jgi:hypothetical protein
MLEHLMQVTVTTSGWLGAARTRGSSVPPDPLGNVPERTRVPVQRPPVETRSARPDEREIIAPTRPLAIEARSVTMQDV